MASGAKESRRAKFLQIVTRESCTVLFKHYSKRMDYSQPHLSSYEGKMIFSLLDAAEEDNLIFPFSLYERWRDLKRSSLKFLPSDSAALYWFADEVARAGLLANTWMLDRWNQMKEHVENNPLVSTMTPAKQAKAK